MPVRVNMATSLDGKIAPASREKIRMGSDADIGRMEALRAWADVIVIGAGTVRAEDPPMGLKEPRNVASREAEGRPANPAVAVVSGSLRFAPGRLFRSDARSLVITTSDAPRPAPELAEAAEIWRLGEGSVDIAALVERFYAEGMDRILVEGGGALAAAFFQADLVDEIYVTVTPWLLGGHDAPALATATEAFDPPIRFDLVLVEAGPEELFLTYRRAAGPQ